MLPLLIRVLACFSKLDDKILEEEIDSSLGFLRHDYPEAVYSALRKEFRQALHEQPDLEAMAAKLNGQLTPDRKILLGIQLWDLICRAGQQAEQVVAFYKFMAGLGMTAQAIDIVYQLNASEATDAGVFQKGPSPLESLTFGSDKAAVDVFLKDLPPEDRLFIYRYHDLILIKNLCSTQVVVNGRPLVRGHLGRLYEGQRVVLGERVIAYQELVGYFNAKKNVAVPQLYLAINRDDEVSFERGRTRDSVLEVRFGLKVQVTALKRVPAQLNGIELKAGTRVEGTLEDKILFNNHSELPLSELRRRARALGGRFQLIASKSEYLVSNNPSLLDSDDILLSPGTGGDVLLKISCDYDQKLGQLEVLQASRSILVGDTPVRHIARLVDGDLIRIDVGQVLRCNFAERMIEEERNVIRVLEARDLRHSFHAGRNRAGQHFLHGHARRDGLRHGVERLRQEHAAAHARRAELARQRRGRPQRALALRRHRRPARLHRLHPAGRRLRRATDHRRKPLAGRRVALAAPLGPRARPAHRQQAHRTRPQRTPQFARRQRGQKIAQRRRAQTTQHRARHDRHGRHLPLRRADERAVEQGQRARRRHHQEHEPQQDRARDDPPAQLEDFRAVQQGDPARQGRTAGVFSARPRRRSAISRRRKTRPSTAWT